MISDVSAILMRDFATNMQDRIERIERGESAEQIAAAGGSSVGGSRSRCGPRGWR